jgi:glycerophosphoryl diester phosphodiesterase
MRFITITGILIMAGCATFEAGAPDGRVDVIAHRGASAYAPENTLASFRKAIDLDADWFELDCTLTRDGEVVVIHDNTLERTTGGVPGDVKDYTLAEIERYDVGTWFDPVFAAERIPTLGETLDLATGRIGVYVEIKNSDDDSALTRDLLAHFGDAESLFPDYRDAVLDRIEASGSRNLDLTRKVIALIRDRRMQRQVVVQSFSPVVCAVALIEAPDIRTELLASSSDKDPLQWNRFLQWARLLRPAGFNVNKNDVTQSLIQDIHARGMTLAVWTVNDPDDMRQLARWGVDALITNYPDVARETLAGIN